MNDNIRSGSLVFVWETQSNAKINKFYAKLKLLLIQLLSKYFFVDVQSKTIAIKLSFVAFRFLFHFFFFLRAHIHIPQSLCVLCMRERVCGAFNAFFHSNLLFFDCYYCKIINKSDIDSRIRNQIQIIFVEAQETRTGNEEVEAKNTAAEIATWSALMKWKRKSVKVVKKTFHFLLNSWNETKERKTYANTHTRENDKNRGHIWSWHRNRRICAFQR